MEAFSCRSNYDLGISKLHFDAWYISHDPNTAGSFNGRKLCKYRIICVLWLDPWRSFNLFIFSLHLSIQGDKARVIQTLLFVAGIKTLLQTLFGTRLPVIVGGSYAFVIPVLSIINDSSLKQIPDPHEVWSQDKLIKWCICLKHLSSSATSIISLICCRDSYKPCVQFKEH